MKNIFFLFLMLLGSLFSQTTPNIKKNVIASSEIKASALSTSDSTRAILTIDPKLRTQDIIQTYNEIKKDATSSKIIFYLNNNKTISNIVDITSAANATLLIFKTTTNVGIKQEAVFIEDIISISTL
ncbi:MAG: hypothetical protein K1060chlam5_00922 [Candidatus Anoxychlamydiales bacterium]|nr:hypothetical protein [Candidatus Anoxychlamydiales bacterium]